MGLVVNTARIKGAGFALATNGRALGSEVRHAAQMFTLFGRAKQQPSTPEIIAKNHEFMNMNEKALVHMQKKAETERVEAKRKVKCDRRKAIGHLKRAKAYEARAEQYQSAIDRLQDINDALAESLGNTQTFEAIRQGTAALKAAQGDLTLEKVEEIADDLQEQMEISREMSGAISRQTNPAEDEDLMAELNDELDEMEADLVAKEFLSTVVPGHAVAPPVAAVAPAYASPAPQTAPAAAIPNTPATSRGRPAMSPEEQEMHELEASMAL